MKQRILPAQKEKFFPEFLKIAEPHLRELRTCDDALLFSSEAVTHIIEQLASVHTCLQHSVLALGDAGRDFPGRVALGLLKGAPTILGVKPVSSFRLEERELEQLRGLRAIEDKTPDRISIRTRKHQPGEQRMEEIMVFAFNMEQLGRALDAVEDESIASQFTGIREALANQSVDTVTASSLSMWDSKPVGVLYGFPEEAVKETMGLQGETRPQSLNRSRWLDIAISETEATHPLVQRTLDRFDTTAEVMGDYLRCIWSEPTDFKNVWRFLEKEPRGERMTPEITLKI